MCCDVYGMRSRLQALLQMSYASSHCLNGFTQCPASLSLQHAELSGANGAIAIGSNTQLADVGAMMLTRAPCPEG